MEASEGAAASLGLSQYELDRMQRIRRNRDIMSRLGLLDNDVLLAAQQRSADTGKADPKPKKDAEKKRKAELPPSEPSRRSRRLQDNEAEEANGEATDADKPTKRGSAAASETLDGLHELAEEQHRLRNAGRQERASIVGTASYQHTLMRVRTMDEPGLRRRIAAIERARGKHAVAKMRLFARVLFLEGHQEMAAEAAAALERLVRELGDPEAEEEGGEGGEAATEAEAEAEGGGGGEGAEATGASAGAAAPKPVGERLSCGSATPLDNPAVYADCLEAEGLAPGAILERLGKDFPAAPGSAVLAAQAGQLRLLLKSGNVLTVRVVADKGGGEPNKGGGGEGKKKAAAAPAGKGKGKGKGKKGAAAAASAAAAALPEAAATDDDEEDAVAAVGGALEYDVSLP